MKVPLFLLDINPEDDSGVDAIGLVEQPAIEMGWQAFDKAKSKFAVVNESEQILAGALMVADMPIPRVDEFGNLFYVKFTAEAIKNIVTKIKKNGVKLVFNINHEEDVVVDSAYLFSDFLINSKMKMQAPEWHKELPEGSWFGFVKIEDKKAYEYAKENLTGFSVEGFFDQWKIADKEAEILEQLRKTYMKKNLTVAGKIAEMKKLLFGEEEMPKEEKMESATLEDGTTIEWEGNLAEGVAIQVITEEGAVAAPDATHTLADGTKITTEGGVVTAIEMPAAEEAELEKAIEELSAVVTEANEQFKKQAKTIEGQAKAIENLQKVNKQMFSVIEGLMKDMEPKKDQFGKQQMAASDLPTQVKALSSILKNSKK